MSDNQFIEVDAPHLCVMENESEKLCKDGIYGKAMAEYLQAKLKKSGYIVSCVVLSIGAGTSKPRSTGFVWGFVSTVSRVNTMKR